MLKRFEIALLLMLLAMQSAFVFVSVGSVANYLLKMDVKRQQLLNYELSSRLLQQRFSSLLSGREDFNRDVRGHVLESTILNFSDMGQGPGYLERSGVIIVNAIRLLSGKSWLHLTADEQRLRLLQYAFFLERSKQLKAAASIFAKVSNEIAPTDEDSAFIHLHEGYCQFLLGDEKEAERLLTGVIAWHPGSHFATSAETLLMLMKQSKIQAQAAADQKDPADRGDAYYRVGRYALAVSSYEKSGSLTDSQKLSYSRSLEESGNSKKAVESYTSLAQSGSPELQKQAARRLLIFGSFLGGSEETTKFAKQKAEALGDHSSAIIEDAKSLLKPQDFIPKTEDKAGAQVEKVITPEEVIAKAEAEIPEMRKSGTPVPTVKPAEVEPPNTEKKEVATNKAAGPPVETPKNQKPASTAKPEEKSNRSDITYGMIEVALIDGRVFVAKSLQFQNEIAFLDTGDLQMELPSDSIFEIRSAGRMNVDGNVLMGPLRRNPGGFSSRSVQFKDISRISASRE